MLLTCFPIYFLCLYIRCKTDSGYQIISLYRLNLHCIYADISFRCKFRFFAVCVNSYCRSCIGQFLCFMHGEIAVSKNCHILASVKESIADCTVTDTFSLKFLNSRNLRCSTFTSCCKDHTLSLEFTFCGFYHKGIKPADSQNLCIQYSYAQCFRLSDSCII